MQRQLPIEQITSLTRAITKLAKGDCLYFDIDDTLLRTGLDKYSDAPQLTESELAAELSRLRERGVKLFGLTSRKLKYKKQTEEQLQQLGIVLDEVIHAPSTRRNDGSKHLSKGLSLYHHQKDAKLNQHIYVFDNDRAQLEDIQQFFITADAKQSGSHLHLKHYVAPQYQPVNLDPATNHLFPNQLEDFRKQQALGGGTNSVFSITNETATHELVLKSGAHADAAKIEILCNIVYRALGVKVPPMRVYHTMPAKLALSMGLKSPHGMFQVSAKITEHAQQSDRIISAAARKDFAAHVLLGNIDVAKADNFIVDPQQEAWLIDAGANFMFRAKGAVRKENPATASEIDSLRNKNINERGHEWFGSLTDEEIAAQVTNLLEKHAAIEAAVWDASSQLALPDDLRNQFLEYLSDRLDQLAVRFCRHSQRHAKTDKKAEADKTAAGILTYIMLNNEPHLLLSQRVRHTWWDNFGGKSSSGDRYLSDTALREVAEESGRMLQYTSAELLASPFHDIVTGFGHQQQLYRMYISPYHQIDLTFLNDKEHTAQQIVPLKAVLAALDSKDRVMLEGKETVVVHTHIRDIPLFPPLFRMLQQPEVYANLQELMRSKTLKKTHTLSYDQSQPHQHGHAYRPLATPETKRQQITAAHLGKSAVLREFKRTRQAAPPENAATNPERRRMAQSEVHMKAVLGNLYREGDLEANVRTMVSKFYDTSNLCKTADKERFIRQSCTLIENERAGGSDQTYFYHACNNKIAFVYDVYQALYQTLHADDNWQAFRPDSEHFKKFDNIEAFIAFYSAAGSKKINNNDAHFNDCALSTNVFLFGNYHIPTSSSIHYWMDNDVRRSIDLAALFTVVLQPFQVSREEIARLIKVFDLAKDHSGGTLYQIAMPNEQAERMAYPAKTMGVLKELDGSRNLPAIMQNLQTRDLTDAATAKYVKKLQARVMVPPHLPLQVTTTPWRAMPGNVQTLYQRELQQCVGYIAASILRRHSSFHVTNKNTAMVKVLPSILADNQISMSAAMSDAVLARAILSNDGRMVKQILQVYPEYKTRRIVLPQAYINVNGWQPSMQAMTPLEMMSKHSKIPMYDIMACYNSEDWQTDIGRIEIVDPDNMLSILQAVPEEQRLQILRYFGITFFNDKRYIDLVYLLPDKQREIFITQNLDKILKRHTDYNIHNLVMAIPHEDRLNFVLHNMQIFSGSDDDLACIVEVLDIDDREQLVTQTTHQIRHANIVARIIRHLPEAARLAFAERHREVMGIDRIDSENLITVVAALSREQRANYLCTMRLESCDQNCAANLVSLMPPAERLNIATRLRNHIGADMGVVINHLNPEDKLFFARTNTNTINSGKSLAAVLHELAPADRLDFAIAQRRKIEDACGLAAVIAELAVDQRYQFVMKNDGTIKTWSKLAAVLREVVIPVDELITRFKPALLCTESLDHVLEVLPQPDKIVFLQANLFSIYNEEILCRSLLAMEPATRFEIAAQFTSLINHVETFKSVITTLPSTDRLKFAALLPRMTKTIGQLLTVISLFNISDQLEYIKMQNVTGGNLDDNCRLLKALDPAIQPGFAMQLLNQFGGYADTQRLEVMRNIARSLQGESQLALAITCIDVMDEHFNRWIFLELDQTQRARYIDAYHARKQNWSYLSWFLGKMTGSNRVAVLDAYMQQLPPDWHWRFDLVVELLAVTDRGRFALRHAGLIKDVNTLTNVLASQDDVWRLDVALKCLNLIKDNHDAVAISQLLTGPGDALVFTDRWKKLCFMRNAAKRQTNLGLFAAANATTDETPDTTLTRTCY